MNVQKLTWAGLLVESGNSRILIDPIMAIGERTEKVFGPAKEPYIPFGAGETVAILHTHTHNDHFDPQGIIGAFGDRIPVLVPADSKEEAEKAELKHVIGASVGSSFTFGPFTVTAAQAVDGFGSPQIAWVVEAEGKRIFHTGDTLWHGFWWAIAQRHGPFEAAFLPVNAALIVLPGQKPSGHPISLSPEEAVTAARILTAKRLIPIHYRTFHNPPTYVETSNVAGRLLQAARIEEQEVHLLDAGEIIEL